MAKSLQDILKRRQQEEFVGREEQLAFFQENLSYAPEDPRRRFVISVSGQGGVGKTWLLRRLRKIAEEAGAVTAYTDKAEDDIPGVMGRIAEQFEARDHPLESVAERYKVYCQRRQEIETDPDAPQGFPSFLGRTLAKGGLRLARQVPVGGMVADFVDEEDFASLVGDLSTYVARVARKIRNKDEVRLVLEPVEVLTPLFLAGLRKVTEKHTVALFFDTYEHTGEFLDPWLRNLLEGRYGDAPANILLAIAGRDGLDHNLWATYEGLLARLSLEPFTEEEAHDYLARKGIIDERVVEVVLGLSGRLPLLVATLASESPDDPAKVGDPSGEAVERFLKWVEDPKQRQMALDAALPRLLNRDVVAALVGEEEANALFTWLRRMPFVEKRGDGWAYHNVVRAQMLRYKRQESPQGWADLHGRLAEYYEGLRDRLGLEEEAGLGDQTWQLYELEVMYHRLCENPHKYMADALNGFIAALESTTGFASRWAKVVKQAGKERDVDQVLQWGESLLRGVAPIRVLVSPEALTEGTKPITVGDLRAWGEVKASIPFRDSIDLLSSLLDSHLLADRWRPTLLVWQGELFSEMGELDDALENFNRTLDLQPRYARALVGRGNAYRIMNRLEEALEDLDRALKLEPHNARAFLFRGLTFLRQGRYQEASSDGVRALELSDGSDPFVLLGAFQIAIATATYQREEAVRQIGESVGQVVRAASERLSRSVSGVTSWVLAQSAEFLNRLAKAFGESIKLLAQAENLASQGHDRLLEGKTQEAIELLDSAIEIWPNEQFRYERVLAHMLSGDTSTAVSYLKAIIDEAQQLYDEYPQDWPNLLNLALYRLAIGETSKAEQFYRETLSGNASPHHIRDAIRDLDNFLTLFPDHPKAHAMHDLLWQHLQKAER